MTESIPDRLSALVSAFLADHDPRGDRLEFLRARFDAGLSWLHFPEGHGGLGVSRVFQPAVDAAFAAAGAPDNRPRKISVGLGMAAPTLLHHGNEAQRQRFLRPLWTGEEVWCQLFSEPGAGSDLAGLACRAVRDGDGWVVDGQKVWTSQAFGSRWGILLARTDPTVPKHRGLTFFACDMHAPGVEVRPLRQLTGETEFNEVFLTGVRLGDDLRLGEVGDGWAVARTTLMNERVSIGGGAIPREGGLIGVLAKTWRTRPDLRTPGAHDALLRAWVRAEAIRLTGQRVRQQLAAGEPGPEGSAVKLSYAAVAQEITGLELEILGEQGLRHDDWTLRMPGAVEFLDRSPTHRYLRAKGNSIEGGTSEILRNIVAERVLGLPAEPRRDLDLAWKDLAK
ncbi:alkylation response protein AidB-like acyl-CoA dehydrogenase [Allocatelliglobosispora scoriae]|uniref:Alkylation response protein AidB-like acyl-CoA dehydrogenase n=1 Tax=Allocatelliglobosispora scoriae TaxID=643052 RepID=A0A841BWV2_9ACTN|nr:acyl-CoA dehydrogenase family protein [Allocatelliglobosispora scoriae]MBB5872634.1 alkylation response protein AidB-like acyl-CoA dehydrogenase [Allocatelliglobosispora scoriae]